MNTYIIFEYCITLRLKFFHKNYEMYKRDLELLLLFLTEPMRRIGKRKLYLFSSFIEIIVSIFGLTNTPS